MGKTGEIDTGEAVLYTRQTLSASWHNSSTFNSLKISIWLTVGPGPQDLLISCIHLPPGMPQAEF